MKKFLILLLCLLVAQSVQAVSLIKINKVQPIPKVTYKYLDENSPMYEILSQNKKVLFYNYADHMAYDRLYKWEIDRFLQNNPSIAKKYEYMIFEDAVTPVQKYNCKTPGCDEHALFVNCCAGICIINPKTKEYIYISGHNYIQARNLIKKYQDW